MESAARRMAKKVRVLVADNSRIHTQLLSDALQRDSGLDVVHWDCNPASLVPAVLSHNIDVLAISSTLNGHSGQGLRVVRELRSVSPATKTVVLLDSHEDDAVISAFRAGAKGIFSRESSADIFCKCMHSVHDGEIWVDSRGVSLAIDALASAPSVRAFSADGLNLLSKREMEVVQSLVQGLTNREIADSMGLSQHTVKNYLFRIFDKLGVSSRVELLFMALSQNNAEDSLLSEVSQKAIDGGPHDEATLAVLEKAAEKGSPAAQLALAQAYLSRRSEPEDLVRAHMWFSIASERVSNSRSLLTRMMSPKQVDEAQQRAGVWLAREKHSPASTREASHSSARSAGKGSS